VSEGINWDNAEMISNDSLMRKRRAGDMMLPVHWLVLASEGKGEDGDVVFLAEVLGAAGDFVGGVGSWSTTLAARTKTRRGWGTRHCFGAEKRQQQEQPQILRLRLSQGTRQTSLRMTALWTG
jgi:hypothetical protein